MKVAMAEEIPGLRCASGRLTCSLQTQMPLNSANVKKIRSILQGNSPVPELTLNITLQNRLKKAIRKGVPISLMRELILQLWNLPVTSDTYSTIKSHQQETDAYAAAACPTFSLSEHLPDSVTSLLSAEGLAALKRVLWAVSYACAVVKYCPILPCLVALSLLFLSENEAFLLTNAIVRHSNSANSNPNFNWHFVFSQTQHQRLYSIITDFIQSKESKLAAEWERNGVKIAAVAEELIESFYAGSLHWSTLQRLYCCYLSEGMRVFLRFTLGVMKKLKGQIRDLASSKDVVAAISQALSNPITAEMVFNAGMSARMPKTFPKWQAPIALPDCIPLQISPSPLTFLVQSTILTQRDFQRLWQELPPRYQLMTPVLVYSSESDGIHLPTLLRKSTKQGKSPGIFLLLKSLEEWKFGVFVDSWLRVTEEFVGGYDSFFFTIHPRESVSHICTENHYVLHVSESDFTVGEGPHGPALSLDMELVNGYSAVSSTFANEVIANGSFVLKSLELFALTA